MESALEKTLTNCYKDEMISFLNSHPECFEEAVELAVSDKQPYSWRAAWLLWSVIEENDKRIKKFIKRIVNAAKTKSDSHQRELLKILLMMELDEKYESVLFDVCMNIWEQISKAPAVRVNALKLIVKIANKHPELKKEIPFLAQDHYLESLSPGARHSVRKLMKKAFY
ncbi:MAG TPA: hypothetical protein VLH59_10810 [Ignavibacteriaceae bacterium]|nr:hypothetical protein [Ignavibacteriaceae bacterium]